MYSITVGLQSFCTAISVVFQLHLSAKQGNKLDTKNCTMQLQLKKQQIPIQELVQKLQMHASLIIMQRKNWTIILPNHFPPRPAKTATLLFKGEPLVGKGLNQSHFTQIELNNYLAFSQEKHALMRLQHKAYLQCCDLSSRPQNSLPMDYSVAVD